MSYVITGDCCPELKKAIEQEIVLVVGDKAYIKGKSCFIPDGDGHYDDMTDEIEIKFCPWSGDKL